MTYPETIKTQRLILRRPRLDDAAALFEEYAQDPEVTRYLVWRPHRTIEETVKFLEQCEGGWTTGSELTWAITRRGSDRVIGMLAFRPDGYKADLGYVLARSYWNKGYMTEAVSAIVEWALTIPEIYRVWAVCDAANVPSARVLEKAGMVREGVLKRWSIHPNVSAEPRDCFAYARTREPASRASQPAWQQRFTKLQGQYLAFIASYTKMYGRPPAEADLQAYFRVTPPTIHQMIVTLEKRGLIARTPGQARSIQVLVPQEELPFLG